ncbi:MAG: lipid biosynthesis B12-binding/radical SAM protein [Desulfobacteraceae bacterium]|jgi:radical SAM superfamily enzyme YgiQ (UPF0313 family)
MKVLLISANTLTAPYPVYPLGLDYVAAALAPDHRVKIADMNLIDMGTLARQVDEFNPGAVGISLRNIDNTDTTDPRGFIPEYENLVQIVRKHTDAPIVLGGAGFSIFPEKILSALAADYGVVGEGERLAALLEAIENRQPMEALPGIVTPDHPYRPADPLTKIPSRNLNSGYGHMGYYLEHGGMLNLQTKRGCPLRCIYCTYPHIEGRRFRLIAPDEVARSAKTAQEAGAKYIFITDSAFNADIGHSLAVADQFRKTGVSIPWGAFLAPMKMPEHYFDALKNAGMRHVEFGTESLSDRVLEAYGKPFNRRQIHRTHDLAVAAGLHVAHYFLLGGPGETTDTLETTLSHIDKLKKSVLFLFCGMRIYPNTALFDLSVRQGRLGPSSDLLEPVFYQSADIRREEIIDRVTAKADKRINWVIGSGGDETSALVKRMYAKGYSGPLWEYLIR